ncbi:MAG: T9SS type A sorting domain-containing protein [Flavobacterium sp.]|nr:T9SS type A sorting domain-containing protein [Flavobacterium sp.]
MNKILFILAMALVTSFANAQVQKGSDVNGEAAYDRSGNVSMPDANTMAIGAIDNDGNGNASGHVRVYSWNGSAWVRKGVDINGEAMNDWSGYSVSMPDANTVAIGAPYNDGSAVDSGHVRIYSWNGSAWVQKGIDIDGEAADDNSGSSVSMPDSNTVAIAGKQNDGNGANSGHVSIYSWNGSAWVQKGMDIDGEAADDNSGSSVSMPDSNTVAIGATQNDGNGSNSGHVRIYSWNGSSWVQKGTDIDGEANGDYSGLSISMPDANTVAIGAQRNDGNGVESGHVRIYNWNGSAWVQKGIDIDGDTHYSWLGYSVSMPDANTVAIGAIGDDANGYDSGSVRIYSWNGSAWMQLGVDINGEAAEDYSGNVSMPDVNTVAIGANGNDGNGTSSGHVRVYDFSTLSVKENTFDEAFSIYPNPTNAMFTVEVPNDSVKIISVVDITGKVMATSNVATVDVSNLASGIYVVKVETISGKIGMKKLVRD